MKRVLLSALVLGILTASTATAQHARFSAGAGLLLSNAEGYHVGWQFTGAAEWTIPRTPLGLRADGMYGRILHTFRDPFYVGGVEPWYGGTASLVHHLGAPIVPLRLYLLAGVGYITTDGSEFSPAFVGGAGLSIGAGRVKVFVEGRFMSFHTYGDALNFFPVTTGLSFGSP